jgi:hypothetical protein
MNRWIAAVLLLAFVAMAAVASGYPADAKTMPIALGVAGAALCLIQLGLDFASYRNRRGNRVPLPAPKLGRPLLHDEARTGLGPQTLSREIATWGYFLAFIAALIGFGFHVAVPTLVFLYLRLEARTTLATAAAAAASAWAALFAIAGGLFGFALFPGLAGPALRSWLGH